MRQNADSPWDTDKPGNMLRERSGHRRPDTIRNVYETSRRGKFRDRRPTVVAMGSGGRATVDGPGFLWWGWGADRL